MKFREIISISGQSGLFTYLTQNRSGIIVESLADKRRFPIPTTSKVSSLADIAIFTEGEDMPLAEVFQAMSEKLGGKEALSAKSAPAELAAALGEYVPDYDRGRVHASDIKKIFMWYNILVNNGMTEFVEPEEAENEEKAE